MGLGAYFLAFGLWVIRILAWSSFWNDGSDYGTLPLNYRGRGATGRGWMQFPCLRFGLRFVWWFGLFI